MYLVCKCSKGKGLFSSPVLSIFFVFLRHLGACAYNCPECSADARELLFQKEPREQRGINKVEGKGHSDEVTSATENYVIGSERKGYSYKVKESLTEQHS